MHSKWIAAAVTGMVWMAAPAVATAAPAAAGAGGGGSGGGGHAAPSGGGGGGHSAPSGGSSGGGEVRSAPSAAPRGSNTPGSAPAAHASESSPQSGRHVGNSARRYQRFYSNGNLGNYYSYPYWPYGYGYNGWYGNNYAYNQSPFYYSNDHSNNDSNNNGDQGGTYPVPGTGAPTTAPAGQSAGAVSTGGGADSSSGTVPNVPAQIDNAVLKSPAMVAANNSVQRAQSALDTERQRVLASLRDKPEYEAALSRRHDAAHDVAAAQSGSGVHSDAVIAAANQKLDASDEVTRIQEQAIAADPAAAAAKARLEQAVADQKVLQAQMTTQLRSAGPQK